MPRCTACGTVQPSAELRRWPSGPKCKDRARCELRRETKGQLPLFEEKR